MLKLGLDVGSTTLKAVLLDGNEPIFKKYVRHCSRISETAVEVLGEIDEAYQNETVFVSVSGSAGMGVANTLSLPFVQEVYAEKRAVERLCPHTDAVVELGGEDAKILFLTGGFEMRMNGSCAGGTGAFIDQMASLMRVTPETLNDLAEKHEKVYSIASRCGVFAKSDVQPLLNQGARKEDVAEGILRAVVGQTVAGLAQGRKITGNVVYLGGPLTFFPRLRAVFDLTLGLHGTCPENSLYFVAIGATEVGAGKEMKIRDLIAKFGKTTRFGTYESLPAALRVRGGIRTVYRTAQTLVAGHKTARYARKNDVFGCGRGVYNDKNPAYGRARPIFSDRITRPTRATPSRRFSNT